MSEEMNFALSESAVRICMKINRRLRDYLEKPDLSRAEGWETLPAIHSSATSQAGARHQECAFDNPPPPR